MKKILKWMVISVLGIFVLLTIMGTIVGPQDKQDEIAQAEQPTLIPETQTQVHQYEVVKRADAGSIENIDVLIEVDERNPESIAREVEKTCKKDCNVNLYDDKKALELQQQYDEMMGKSMTTPADMTAWKEKNYVFVADHFVGYIELSTQSYDEYPFKDWYYEELKR